MGTKLIAFCTPLTLFVLDLMMCPAQHSYHPFVACCRRHLLTTQRAQGTGQITRSWQPSTAGAPTNLKSQSHSSPAFWGNSCWHPSSASKSFVSGFGLLMNTGMVCTGNTMLAIWFGQFHTPARPYHLYHICVQLMLLGILGCGRCSAWDGLV